ncbi:PREDICTED: transmembrane protein 186 [Papilio polytes]|uniref:transmembrane protein 186 n=1 Tax=Papilio polytes TaxID=76194 RepID=UPI000675F89E|nr:PREDICTED: transmembrane protein 186 [Papilio polytes]
MLKSRIFNYITKNFSSQKVTNNVCHQNSFETVYSFPQIKYIAIINRLKVYHLLGSGVAIPSCGLLELCDILSSNSFLTASYIGVTGAAVLSLASLPFRNLIGFLYISEDNKLIKISSLDFWGQRKDRIINADDWIPLYDMPPKFTDQLYRTPKLSDGTKYKLVMKYGKIINATKVGQVLE